MKKKKDTTKLKARVLYAYSQNPDLSIREISKITGVPKSTVDRWIKEAIKEKQAKKIERLYYKTNQELRERIIQALLKVVSQKGRTRAAANKRMLYRLFELDFNQIGVKDEKTASELISYIVKQEFGSWEKLEAKRRPFKEHSKYRSSKGRIERTPALLEIDGTGLTFEITENGEKLQVSLFIALDVYSGYVFPMPLLIDNKTKPVRFYNKAFNSREVAKFLLELFIQYGLPKQIRTDNDPTIKNEYLNNTFQILSLEALKAKRPNQKFIERIIEDFKKYARYYQATNQPRTKEEIYETALQAIKACNSMERKFSIFNQTHTPEEVFAAIKEQYKPIDPLSVRRAFMETKEIGVRNNKIEWDGYVYEFLMPQKIREGEYGRKPKAPQVLVKRHIDNASFIEVYDIQTGEFIGEARLISSDVPTINPMERRQLKSAEKRARQKAKKLNKEIQTINQEVEKVKEEIKEQNIVNTDEILNTSFSVEKEEENLPSVWEILTGGSENA